MVYYTGCIAAVPAANREKYLEHVHEAWPLMRKHGAERMVECWGADIPKGKVNDLPGAVQAREDERVVFSWIEWPDKARADAGFEAMGKDPAMKEMAPMPFDGSRMIYGGFEPVFSAGTDREANYYQGFALAVPGKNREAYVKMASDGWENLFRKSGCQGMVEGWGVDVPHGKQTDFYRATLAEDGEVPLFSWVAWPDRATCDKAAKEMEASMQGQPMPEMPFDGMRMMWGGFEPIFDSAAVS